MVFSSCNKFATPRKNLSLRAALSVAARIIILATPIWVMPHTAAISATETQIFSDDFEDGNANGWTTNGGTWDIIQPPGHSKEYRKASSSTNLSLIGDSSWSNYSVQGYVKLADENGGISLIGRAQNPAQFYQIELKKDPATGVKKWWIWKNNNEIWTLLASGSYNFSANSYYLMRLDMQGSTLTAYSSTDWGATFQTLGAATDSSYPTGKIGVRIINSGGQFDQIKVSMRDKWQWPFASTSIWNMPIGSGAIYTPANIQQALYGMGDQEYFYKLKAGDPLRPVYSPGGWSGGRCTGTQSMGVSLPIPDNLIVPDARIGYTPNNASAFLMPDGKTIEQFEPLARCTVGGAVYGWRNPWGGVDIYSDGIRGTHFGSGLSAIGGSIRLGELTNNEPIRHSLKLLLWGRKYLYYSAAIPGYRWPATNADSGAADVYTGTNPKLVEGSLLAIPPSVTEASLNLQTPAGKKLFRALQNYGGYIADDPGWDVHYFGVEKGVFEEFQATYGYPFETGAGPFYDDYMKLFKALYIVDNNGPNSIGGGGTPRAPLAPPIGN